MSDELRGELAAVIREHIFGDDTPSDEGECCADALLPVIDADVQAELERIAQAIENDARTSTVLPKVKLGLERAARIVREHAEEVGSGG